MHLPTHFSFVFQTLARVFPVLSSHFRSSDPGSVMGGNCASADGTRYMLAAPARIFRRLDIIWFLPSVLTLALESARQQSRLRPSTPTRLKISRTKFDLVHKSSLSIAGGYRSSAEDRRPPHPPE